MKPEKREDNKVENELQDWGQACVCVCGGGGWKAVVKGYVVFISYAMAENSNVVKESWFFSAIELYNTFHS